MNIQTLRSDANLILQGSHDDVTLRRIIEILKAADDLYHNDSESFLEDYEYDAIRLLALQLDPTNSYFIGVGADVRGGKIKLPFELGSLDQIEIGGEIEKWVKKEALTNEDFILTDKLDGTSALIIYDDNGDLQIAYSRGDGVEGADVTRHISKIHNVPKKVDPQLRAPRVEVILSQENFNYLQPRVLNRAGRQYKNARNMVAGIMNAEENLAIVYDYIEVVAYHTFVPQHQEKENQLKMLKENGFKIPFYTRIPSSNLTDTFLTSYLTQRRKKSSYAIDGIVIDVNNKQRREEMNPTRETLNPAYSVKYKVADENNVADARVIKVEWRLSKHGYWKPRVHVEPIELVGVTIRHATGFNAKFIVANNIGPGAVVRITRSGDVIPYIVSTVTPASKPDLPLDDYEWVPNDDNDQVDIRLPNAHENETVMFEQINDFFAAIEAPFLRKGNIQKLIEAGYTSLEDIIKMSRLQMVAIIGTNGNKVYDGLRARLNQIPLYALMGASTCFGRGVGVRKMKKLYQVLGDNIISVTENDIVSVEGFEKKTAQKIINGLPIFNAFLKEIEEYVTIATAPEKTSEALNGEQVVFTGFRDKELHAAVEAAGGVVQSGYSSKTTIVVAKDPTGNSGKLKKARDAGTKIIGVDELRSMLGEVSTQAPSSNKANSAFVF